MLSKYQEKSFKDQNSLLPIIDNKLTHQRVIETIGFTLAPHSFRNINEQGCGHTTQHIQSEVNIRRELGW